MVNTTQHGPYYIDYTDSVTGSIHEYESDRLLYLLIPHTAQCSIDMHRPSCENHCSKQTQNIESMLGWIYTLHTAGIFHLETVLYYKLLWDVFVS